jgi:hypothetical protein
MVSSHWGGALTEGIEVRPELYCQAINLWRFVSNVERDGLQFSRVVTLRVYGVQTARRYVALIVLSIAVWLGVRQCR